MTTSPNYPVDPTGLRTTVSAASTVVPDAGARQSEELSRFRELLSILDPAALTKSDLLALLDMLTEAHKANEARKAAGVE